MPKTFNAYNLARIAELGTRPLYIVQLGFDMGGGAPWRMTTLDQNITVDGTTYTSTGVKVSGFEHNEVAPTPVVEVNNSDGAVLALIQTEGLGTQEGIIGKLRADSPTKTSFVAADVEQIFDGIISAAVIGKIVSFTLKPVSRTRMIPFIRLGKPVNNWNVQPGYTLRWGASFITVE